jgi:broad specificity phosphatase PhoE
MKKSMRVGLVRHFEVDCLHKRLLSSDEFQKWVKEYDCSPIRVVDTVVNQYKWEKCYCSDLPRAINTAKSIYKGSILESSLIREVPIMPVFKSKIKLPHVFWLIAGRIAWFLSHPSQTELIEQTKDKVEKFVSEIIAESEESVLVVTHGFLMIQLQKELKNRGFFGDHFRNAECGKIYLFEN